MPAACRRRKKHTLNPRKQSGREDTAEEQVEIQRQSLTQRLVNNFYSR